MAVIYRNGRLGLRVVSYFRVGLYIKMVNQPSLDVYFTKHGFIYPLSNLGPRLDTVLEKRALFNPVARCETTNSYIVVDRHGEVWQVDLYPAEEPGVYKIDTHTLPSGNGVAWAASDRESILDVLSGVVASDLSEEAMKEQLMENGVDQGWDFVFMDVKEIADRLNELFPEEPTYSITPE